MPGLGRSLNRCPSIVAVPEVAGVSPTMMRIVVAGAGLAAARACSALRRSGFDGELVVLGAEPHAPYDRPPLSKAVLAGERDDAPLPFDPEALGVRLRTGVAATGLDVTGRVVHTDEGDEPFDRLLLATGAEPIRLPGDGEQLTVRTLEDALVLRRMARASDLVVGVGHVIRYFPEYRAIRNHLIDGAALDETGAGLLAELDASAVAEGIDEGTAAELLIRLRERELRRQLRDAEQGKKKELQETLARLLENAVRPA